MDSKYCSVRPVLDGARPQLYIETYGCQMNINDSEVVLSVLQNAGYSLCDDIKKADVILVNTCSIRENAEQRVWGRLDLFLQEKKRRSGVVVGVLGCMAERLKQSLLEHAAVDFVAGPDSYRRIAGLIEGAKGGEKQMNVALLRDETYSDITPVRLDKKRSLRLYFHNEGLQQYVLILRCAVYQGRREEQGSAKHSEGGPGTFR